MHVRSPGEVRSCCHGSREKEQRSSTSLSPHIQPYLKIVLIVIFVTFFCTSVYKVSNKCHYVPLLVTFELFFLMTAAGLIIYN